MKLCLVIAVLMCAVGARAQDFEPVATQDFEPVAARGIAGVREGLRPQIEVRETVDAQAVTSLLDAAPRAERITVYAVRLLSDNSQNAGANARAAAARFNDAFGSTYGRAEEGGERGAGDVAERGVGGGAYADEERAVGVPYGGAGVPAGAVGVLERGAGPRVDYQTPYFRVTVGRFVDRTDAVALCGRVLGVFPKSFVVEEHVSVE